MSGNKKQSNSSGSNAVLSTLAAVGIGAIAAAGAFFVGKALGEEETEARLKAQQHYQQQNRQAQARAQIPLRRVTPSLEESFTEDEEDEDPKQFGLEKECVICMSEFQELKRRDIEIHTTPCGHLFCASCINRCLLRKQECPTCKQPVAPGQTLRVFI